MSANKDKIEKSVEYVWASYLSRKPRSWIEEVIPIWRDGLADLTEDALMRAVRALCQTSKQPPNPQMIREWLSRNQLEGQRGTEWRDRTQGCEACDHTGTRTVCQWVIRLTDHGDRDYEWVEHAGEQYGLLSLAERRSGSGPAVAVVACDCPMGQVLLTGLCNDPDYSGPKSPFIHWAEAVSRYTQKRNTLLWVTGSLDPAHRHPYWGHDRLLGGPTTPGSTWYTTLTPLEKMGEVAAFNRGIWAPPPTRTRAAIHGRRSQIEQRDEMARRKLQLQRERADHG